MIKAQMKEASAELNRLDLTAMSKKKKKRAVRAFEKSEKETTNGIKDVQRRFAAIDCFVALDEFEEARARI